MSMKPLTPQQKIIELAKMDGLTNLQWLSGNLCYGSGFGSPVPDYLTSYDAIIPLVQKQSAGIQITIATILYQNCCIKTGEPWSNVEVATVAFQQSPEQLANALLQAKGFEV